MCNTEIIMNTKLETATGMSFMTRNKFPFQFIGIVLKTMFIQIIDFNHTYRIIYNFIRCAHFFLYLFTPYTRTHHQT